MFGVCGVVVCCLCFVCSLCVVLFCLLFVLRSLCVLLCAGGELHCACLAVILCCSIDWGVCCCRRARLLWVFALYGFVLLGVLFVVVVLCCVVCC